MPILSIDIGVKNLAYAVITFPKITFDVIDISKTKDAMRSGAGSQRIVERCRLINRYIGNIIKENNIDTVVIEKQFLGNTVAMELMYSIITLALTLDRRVHLFHPKEKFVYSDLEYNTKNKAHKKLSVSIARNFLKNFENKYSCFTFQMLYNFEKYKKQDDIADAINQGIVFALKNDLIANFSKDDYKELILEKN